MRAVVVGGGRIGRALQHSVFGRGKTPLSGRSLQAAHNLDQVLGPYTTVVHAAGPAGEAVCRKDPAVAFALHYDLTERLASWARQDPARRLILLGTVAPAVGFYGPLKRAACRMAQRLILDKPGEGSEQLTVIECGHVIGEGMSVHESPGVVARFIAEAMTRGTLKVPASAAVTIRFTPLSTLIEVVDRLCNTPIPAAPVLSPISPAMPVRELARLVARLVQIMYDVECTIEEWADLGALSGYAEPTGEPVPVKPVAETLMTWLRTPEVKMLFRPRSGRVLRGD